MARAAVQHGKGDSEEHPIRRFQNIPQRGIIRAMSRQRDQGRVARYVVARRGTLGLTQGELASKAEVDRKTINSLENAKTWPNASTRAKIEQALGLAVGDLLRIAEGGVAQVEEDQEAFELLAAIGSEDFDTKARAIIADLPEAERSAVEALYEELLEAEERRARLLQVVLPFLRRRQRPGHTDDDGGSSGIRQVSGG